jgi:3-polyprenyl-4-hydroxybenzoate decarboxylase
MNREQRLHRRIRAWTWFFIIGLVISGVTAIPLVTELEWLTRWFGLETQTSATATSELARWLLLTREALQDTAAKHPMLFYGTDWLASATSSSPWHLLGCCAIPCAIAGCSTSA